ncbi:hypothetical protein [Saccharopolyspora spinosa]|nr:hypothetical protein [Saccharopolyspora spinosa]
MMVAAPYEAASAVGIQFSATKVDGSDVLIRRGKELERIHLV